MRTTHRLNVPETTHIVLKRGRSWRLARARAPDKRVCLREGAEGGEAPRCRDGNSGASAGAIASNLSRGTRNCRWTCRHGSAYGRRRGVPLDDERTEICVIAPKIVSSAVGETEMIANPKRKPHQDNGDSDKRRRQEEALDEALKNTFPASDPVSVEQPTTGGRACRS